jgi:hypothetical protein
MRLVRQVAKWVACTIVHILLTTASDIYGYMRGYDNRLREFGHTACEISSSINELRIQNSNLVSNLARMEGTLGRLEKYVPRS